MNPRNNKNHKKLNKKGKTCQQRKVQKKRQLKE